MSGYTLLPTDTVERIEPRNLARRKDANELGGLFRITHADDSIDALYGFEITCPTTQ